jgi:hypothetical protein
MDRMKQYQVFFPDDLDTKAMILDLAERVSSTSKPQSFGGIINRATSAIPVVKQIKGTLSGIKESVIPSRPLQQAFDRLENILNKAVVKANNSTVTVPRNLWKELSTATMVLSPTIGIEMKKQADMLEDEQEVNLDWLIPKANAASLPTEKITNPDGSEGTLIPMITDKGLEVEYIEDKPAKTKPRPARKPIKLN